MANTNYNTWRTVSKGTVVLRKGNTGFYLVINIGLPTEEKPRPYFFSRYISKEEEAVAEAMDLISLWEAAHKQSTQCNEIIINNQNDGKEVNMANNNHVFHEDDEHALCGIKLWHFSAMPGASPFVDFGEVAAHVDCPTCVRLAFEEDQDARLHGDRSWFEIGTDDGQSVINNQNNGKEVNMDINQKVWVLTDRKISEDGTIAALQIIPAIGDDLVFPALIGRLVRQGSLGQAKFAWLIEDETPLSVRVRQKRQDGSLGSGWKQVIDRPLPQRVTFS